MTSKSSQKARGQILGVMSAARVERALVDWANLPERLKRQIVRTALPRVMPRSGIIYNFRYEREVINIEPALRRLIRRYPEIFNPFGMEANPRIAGDPLFPSATGPSIPIEKSFQIAELFGMLLRKAWDASDQRRRDWYLTDAESFYHKAANRFADPPTYAIPLEALVYYFRRNVDRARHCQNPDCPAPYFFATKKGQKYCIEECAKHAQRAAKRRWWHDNKSVVNPKRKNTRRRKK